MFCVKKRVNSWLKCAENMSTVYQLVEHITSVNISAPIKQCKSKLQHLPDCQVKLVICGLIRHLYDLKGNKLPVKVAVCPFKAVVYPCLRLLKFYSPATVSLPGFLRILTKCTFMNINRTSYVRLFDWLTGCLWDYHWRKLWAKIFEFCMLVSCFSMKYDSSKSIW